MLCFAICFALRGRGSRRSSHFANGDRERMSMSGMDSDILQDDNASLCAAIQSDVAAFLEGLPRLNADAPAFLPTPHLQVSAHGSKCMRGIWVPDGSDGLPVPSGHRPEKSDVDGFLSLIHI